MIISLNKAVYSGYSAVGSVPGLGPGGRVFESRCPDIFFAGVSGYSAVGSVPGLGPGGRVFESRCPDKKGV